MREKIQTNDLHPRTIAHSADPSWPSSHAQQEHLCGTRDWQDHRMGDKAKRQLNHLHYAEPSKVALRYVPV